MTVELIETKLDAIKVFQARVYEDDRGFFMETFNAVHYLEFGIDEIFLQDNFSHSKAGVIRGMHYQLSRPQGKLVFVTDGEIMDVAVDIRVGSPTFGQWVSVLLSAENRKQVYIPAGFAHGFCTLSESANVMYKCTDVYVSGDDRGLSWDDSDVGIKWPVENGMVGGNEVLVSEKDKQNPGLYDVPIDQLPSY